MLGEFEFFSTDFNNWNFDNLINKPDFDPYNNKEKLDPFDYILYKFNCCKSVSGAIIRIHNIDLSNICGYRLFFPTIFLHRPMFGIRKIKCKTFFRGYTELHLFKIDKVTSTQLFL